MGEVAWIEWLRKAAPSAGEWGIMLAPLAIYVLYLAYGVYRQPRPQVCAGRNQVLETWFAASGLLLLGPLTWPLAPLQAWGGTAYAIGYVCYVALLATLLLRELRHAETTFILRNVEASWLAPILQRTLTQTSFTGRLEGSQINSSDAADQIRFEVWPWWRTVVFRAEASGKSRLKHLATELRAVSVETPSSPAPPGSLLTIVGALLLLLVAWSLLFFSWYLKTFEP